MSDVWAGGYVGTGIHAPDPLVAPDSQAGEILHLHVATFTPNFRYLPFNLVSPLVGSIQRLMHN